MDANLRPNLWPDHRVDVALVTALLDKAQVLKLAREELELLRGDMPEERWLEARMAAGAKLVVITDGGEPVMALTARGRTRFHPPKVQVVDTTAAGDAFIGGLLAALVEARLTRDTLGAWMADAANLKRAVEQACRCGAFAVTRPGAYASLPRREDLAALASG